MGSMTRFLHVLCFVVLLGGQQLAVSHAQSVKEYQQTACNIRSGTGCVSAASSVTASPLMWRWNCTKGTHQLFGIEKEYSIPERVAVLETPAVPTFSRDGIMNAVLTVADAYRMSLKRLPNGAFNTVLLEKIGDGSSSQQDFSVKQKIQRYLTDALKHLDRIEIGDSGTLTFYCGPQRLVFDLIQATRDTRSQPASGEHHRHPNEGTLGVTVHAVPSTPVVQSNNYNLKEEVVTKATRPVEPQTVPSQKEVFDIRECIRYGRPISVNPGVASIEIQPVSNGVINVVLRVVNMIQWELKFDAATGRVLGLSPGAGTRISGPPDAMDLERKLTEAIGQIQYILLSKDGNDVQLFSDVTDTRIVLRRLTVGRRLQAGGSGAMMLVLNGGGLQQEIFASSPAYPITMNAEKVDPGHLRLIVDGLEPIPYDFYYDESNGFVQDVKVPSTSFVEERTLMAPEYRIRDVFTKCKSIAYLDDGSIRFDTGALGAVDLNAVSIDDYTIKPETYFRYGRFEPLFTGTPFPISLTLVQDRVGDGAKVVLRMINEIRYALRFQRRDGWVLERFELGESSRFLTSEEAQTEQKLKTILGNVQQLAFETDGTLQFITDNGQTRVLFYRTSGWLPLGSRRLQDFSGIDAEILGQPFDPNWGIDSSISNQPSDPNWGIDSSINNQPSDPNWGIDSSISNQPSDPNWGIDASINNRPSDPNWGIDSSISNQPSDPNWGIDSSISNQPSDPNWGIDSSISNQPAYPTYPGDSNVVGRKNIIPGSYRRNGRSDPLFPLRPFPVTVDVVQPYQGSIEVTLRAINTFLIKINYQVQDGWVTGKSLTTQTFVNVSWDEKIVEDKLVYIFTNVQRVAFETSGQLQFITDNGQTRISFM